MSVALLLCPDELPADLDTHLSYHRSAGVDVVVIGEGDGLRASDVLESHVADGFVHRAATRSQTELARIAVELGATWVAPGTVDEVLWPRGESLGEVLAVIPPRYGVVQGLLRTFVDSGSERASRFESRTIRTALLGPDGSSGAPLAELLRPIYRADPNMDLDAEDWTLGGRRIPLRAWYPIEVFAYPAGAEADPSTLDTRLDEGSLAIDTRLRDVLTADGPPRFVLPGVVEDAAYAIECAAVGEVDLVSLDRNIRDLELRIAALEARFWPTVRRTLRRLARRPS